LPAPTRCFGSSRSCRRCHPRRGAASRLRRRPSRRWRASPRRRRLADVRFGLVHRIMTDALAALGVLAVVSTASMSPWTNAVLLVGLAGALAIPERWQNKPALRHFAAIAPLAIFVIQAARLVAGRSALDV